jgi:hypothetical protein
MPRVRLGGVGGGVRSIGRIVLAGETEVLGEEPVQCHCIHHESHIDLPGIQPKPTQ